MTHTSESNPSEIFSPMSAQTSANADEQLDLRGTPCPINFVRTKLKLEKMEPGKILEVWLDHGEPIEQVPDSLRMEGYDIQQLKDRTDFFALFVQRPSVS